MGYINVADRSSIFFILFAFNFLNIGKQVIFIKSTMSVIEPA